MLPASEKDIDFPSDLMFLLMISLILSSFALMVGLPSVLFNLNLPPIENLEPETLEYYNLGIRYLIRFVGLFLSAGGSYGLISSLLTLKKNRIGWGLLSLLYLAGILFFCYLLLMYLDLLSRYPILSIPTFPIIGLIIGVLGFGTLIRRKNRDYILRKPTTHIK